MKLPGIDFGTGRILMILACFLVTTIGSPHATATSCVEGTDQLLELELVGVRHGDETVQDVSAYRLDELSYAVSTANGLQGIVFVADPGEFERNGDSIPSGAYVEVYDGGGER